MRYRLATYDDARRIVADVTLEQQDDLPAPTITSHMFDATALDPAQGLIGHRYEEDGRISADPLPIPGPPPTPQPTEGCA